MFEETKVHIREDNRMTKLNYLRRMMIANIDDKVAAAKYHIELSLHNFINKVFSSIAKLHGVADVLSAEKDFDKECYANLIETFETKCHKIPEHGLHNLKILTHLCKSNAKIN